MDRAMDLVQRVPVPALLAAGGLAVLLPLVGAAVFGGGVAVALLAVGALAVVIAGGLLALRVHVSRLPLTLSEEGVLGRLDGHASFHFRVQLGRGRRMDRARATVRFLPDAGGPPVTLAPLMDRGEGLVGPWTLVVIDRSEHVRGPGAFEVRVQVRERDREWSADKVYAREGLVAGRFVPAVRTELALWGSAAPSFDEIVKDASAGRPGTPPLPEARASAS